MTRTDADYWQAVLARDPRLDGTFVYAVATTGVYCRPTCPSRRPRREHVVYFSGPDAAEEAGYRACRRCSPRDPRPAPVDLVERARQWIEEHADQAVRLADLGRELGISPYHLQRSFKRVVGVTPREYAASCRLARLKGLLRDGENVTAALYGAGYGSSSRLYETARDRLGMTPDTYRRGGRGTHVRYTIVDCPLGRLIVAATERGICAVGLGSSDPDLEAFLRAELPAAELERDDTALEPWVEALLEHLDRPGRRLDLPIDADGSEFQRRVWEELRLIPYGSTRTYGDVARAIGQPAATRAVARACATNPVAVVVPCHRVVRKDGGLGGYRWGLERKRALLERERAGSQRDEHLGEPLRDSDRSHRSSVPGEKEAEALVPRAGGH